MSESLDVAILAIGSELLNGDGLDTNSQWLSRRLERLGYTSRLHMSCLDDIDDIVGGLEFVSRQARIVITTGGLGPTGDDLTREAVARFLGADLELHPPSLEHIEALFAAFGRAMSPSNKSQAYIPKGARVLTNNVGTAPGFRAERGGVTVYVLPGPPREMRWFWDTYLRGELEARAATPVRAERTFRTFGIGESKVGERLQPLEAEADLELRYAAEEKLGTIRVTILTASGEARAQEAWLQARELVGGRHIGATGNDLLPEAVAGWLHARGLTLATAESCTGGRIAAGLISVPGSSAFFKEGYVTYSNESKTRILGVPGDLIRTQGAVCEEVAVAMAEGARRVAGADIGVGITGIAGPGGGTSDKPVGLVHVAIAGPQDGQLLHKQRRYPGTRELVQVRAAAGTLGLVAQVCKGKGNVR